MGMVGHASIPRDMATFLVAVYTVLVCAVSAINVAVAV